MTAPETSTIAVTGTPAAVENMEDDDLALSFAEHLDYDLASACPAGCGASSYFCRCDRG